MMIAKAIKGKGFRGALDYDLSKAGALMLDTNMAGKTARELAQEFGAVRKLRPTLGKAVLHVSLSAAPGETVTDEQWRDIAKRYIDGMDLDQSQYCVIKHSDTEHEHVHIIANRIRFDGTVVSDSHDYKRQEQIMREIERDYGLQRVAPSIEAERKAPAKGEIELAVRTGESSIKQRLQQICDGAAKDCKSYTEYQERLEAIGVEVVPVTQSAGAKLTGLSYRLDRVTMKGSDLGKAYSPAGLAKRGVTYEQDRDAAAVRSSIERDTRRAFGEPDRELESVESAERGRSGAADRAAGASAGSADRRDPADAVRDRAPDERAERGLRQAAIGIDGELQRRGGGGERSSGELRQRGPSDGVEALRHSSSDGRSVGHSYSSARDTVLALSSPAQSTSQDRHRSAGDTASTGTDRSAKAAAAQMSAIGAERYEIGIRDAATGKMMNRVMTQSEVLNTALPWLKRMNARGNDVYMRPAIAGSSGAVMVDDVTIEKIEQMKRDKLEPAAAIETSPGNFQVWIRFKDGQLSKDELKAIARALAQKYGGDMNSADGEHYGRLAGFTNQKPKHKRESDGRQPFVLLRDNHGAIASDGAGVLQRYEQAKDTHDTQREREQRITALQQPQQQRGSAAGQEYARQAKRLMQRYGADADYSRMDYMIAKDMAGKGWSATEIEKSIATASPAIESRKAGHVEDYARRTTARALAAPDVQQALREIEREQARQEREQEQRQQRSRGMGMGR